MRTFVIPSERKVCVSCKRLLPLDAFSRRSDSYDGHQHTCKVCHRDYMRAWQANRRER